MKKYRQGIPEIQVSVHPRYVELLLAPVLWGSKGMRIHTRDSGQGDHLAIQSQCLEVPLKQSISQALKTFTSIIG
jgi:hypothetical protein